MNTPAEDADIQDDQEGNQKSSSFADKVNDAVKAITINDKGEYQLPDDLPDDVKFAATAEKRRRDTQADLSRGRQEANALKAEKAALLKKLTHETPVVLSADQQEELEELKFSDPDAWRKKLNEYETTARNKRIAEIDEELKQVSAGTLETEELERRKEVLELFKAENEGFDINDDILANDIPPRISKKLETGKISFEQFLVECRDYLKTGKVIKQDDTMDQPNLSKVGGSGKPDQNALKEDIVLSYKNETY